MTGENSSVGIATDYTGLTATLLSASIENGTLNIGAGATITNVYQSANGSNPGGTLTTYGGFTLLQQSGSSGQVLTLGTAAITTITITGNAVLGHRPAAGTDAWATLTIGPNATVDCSQNPVPFTITNSITAAIGAVMTTFNAAQCQIHGGGNYKVVLQGNISLSQVTLNTGGPCAVTIGAS